MGGSLLAQGRQEFGRGSVLAQDDKMMPGKRKKI
jgi:hypothetical protein